MNNFSDNFDIINSNDIGLQKVGVRGGLLVILF